MSFLENWFGRGPESKSANRVEVGGSYTDPESPQPGLCVIAVVEDWHGNLTVEHVRPNSMQDFGNALDPSRAKRVILVNGTERGDGVNDLTQALAGHGIPVEDYTGGEFDGLQRISVTNLADGIDIQIEKPVDWDFLNAAGILPPDNRPQQRIWIEKG